MKLLAIDTATEACSAALYIDGEVLSRFEIAPRQHARLILPMIDSLLSEAGIVVADLDALAFGRGPGGFTGVRIATGVIQGVGFATELPVVPVSTLAALAQGAWREFGYKQIATAIDARMGEVYWGRYTLADNELMQLQGEELVIPPEQVEGEGSGWVGIGSGWTTYSDVMQSQLVNELEEQKGERFPNAHDIALLAVNDFHNGVAVNAAEALPIYLRDKVAKKKGEQ
ncbi:tRNA (adenosine(37)-N6)-threonylcarbamoyltransferase complex dimerization subunit type 1 TsaB [Solemya pervernicosa gill symbiont]|uniref:tRNA threonylcarbamoyladenosine biosynthesis protein TsaB n=2 Tax=Gammaproteobacteria incertae sedis TaxID=118884 RepID=A0A1T2L945_9GAMM|nr:tRNA (adenosine(37)-N6)-threonylcarbamoyltransferase complex dimerization subunit type 1 TsaB [Candidatus Reidiella endopervernicosa]OOZ41623.1 tRNA (adenosine(37)-N6)-threonylcarbamoyltransferase complex dimerization subunit type 1 TsaB [Solemya pervernicosa gill symbiont]QKQ26879.1 tRNA (adenosine(37)-N6)-threonylcarbamoyltransferase complex dimerization subunit type 1 TsaB [Candidatus Reidiella endopervernicosa]